MKRTIALAVLALLATAPVSSAADTIVRTSGRQLTITAPDGTKLCCDSFTFTTATKTNFTLSVVGGMVQLKSAEVTVRAAELHFPDAPPAATRHGA
jgi:hypothetical protein